MVNQMILEIDQKNLRLDLKKNVPDVSWLSSNKQVFYHIHFIMSSMQMHPETLLFWPIQTGLIHPAIKGNIDRNLWFVYNHIKGTYGICTNISSSLNSCYIRQRRGYLLINESLQVGNMYPTNASIPFILLSNFTRHFAFCYIYRRARNFV